MSTPLSNTSASQFQSDDDIRALNSLLDMSPVTTPQQQQQPGVAVNDQDLATFLASASSTAYTNTSPVDVPVYDTPMVINSVGITPAQSIQSLQIGEPSADAAFAAAGLTSGPAVYSTTSMLSVDDPLAASAVDFGESLYGQQFSNVDLAAILSTSMQAPLSTCSPSFDLSLTTSPTGGLFAPTDDFDQLLSGACGITGKRRRQDLDDNMMPAPTGAPLSKRFTMPATFDGNMNVIGAPIQRIASYHPDTFAGPMFTPEKSPIGRVNTVGAIGSSDTALAGQPPVAHQRKVAHNAIERRYRNNINDRISDLRNAVPALQHIRPKKTHSSARASVDTEDEDIEDSDTHVDGVEAATKLNKATILGKSTEYIYYLRRTNDQLKRESLYMQDIIRKLPNGERIVQAILQKAKGDSAVATAELHMPENALHPKKKKRQS
ncbi:HLH-domain-containing protein [Coemansia reversa NRRL 1564]|uniref:HLH-domain-containing protein n=1 Tax=Coemansia reversa (strain ATCC 12441 / NRRL 1564) TaxID=763665 RepID=A0A2G5B840_COERN|nr:HLH-domain-containing protein [Coemansia reversa NRRL 1564]|eukprot:PIA15152.1 HLH-domain-containing protein [Coemansia reversa NRRL 1564]